MRPPNRIHQTKLEIRRLSPAEAEVWVTAVLDTVPPATELRGKLTGPHCPGVTTIELAYPLRPLSSWTGAPGNVLVVRVIVPEPNLWTPETPFVYHGKLELWQDGQCCDTATVFVGLAHAR